MIKGHLPKIIVCLALCLFIFVICLLAGFISATEKPAVETKAEQVEDSKKDIIMAEIKQHIAECYIVETTAEEAQEMLGYELLIPEYLPEWFVSYGIYMNEEIVKQIWADPDKLEILYVTQMKSDGKDMEKEIIFTDIMPDGHWSKYRTFYEYTQNGRYVQGFMFVQEDNRTEYDKILKSLKP